MSSPKSINRLLCEDYCRKWINTPSLTLAKKIYKENQVMFKSVEAVRTYVTTIRGKNGNGNRKKTSDKSLFGTGVPIMPRAEDENWQPYVLPKVNNNILHLQDIHVPYHSEKTIELALEYGINKGVNTLLIGYDFLDFYQLSRFEKDPRARSVRHEIETANKMLDYFAYKLPKVKIFWRNGNHDARMLKYLLTKAPELLDMEILYIRDLLKFDKRGITQIGDKQIVKAGQLNIIHGDEFIGGGAGGVNPARALYLKASHNTLCGHFHKTSEHTDPNINGDVFTAFSIGCACGLHPEYARLNKWNNGFAHILTYPDGTFHVNNMKVIKGKIV